jgi:hypothetical protein
MRNEDYGIDVVLVRSKARRSQRGEGTERLDEWHRFFYKMKRLENEAEAAVRKDAFDVHRYDQELRVLRTTLGCTLFVLLLGLGFSMWLIATGREEIGNPILSAIVTGALSYLAGVITRRGVLRSGEAGSERGG